jgi:3',5'-cyclic-AMP phosphodiesterase
VDLTSVADDEAVLHNGEEVIHYVGLDPDTDYEHEGIEFRTLARPAGARLCTIATANDVHFGEVECGVIEGTDIGPILTVEPGEEPYPDTMNRAAVAEIAAIDPDAVVVKGDLTAEGTDAEYQQFLDCWAGAFGDRLHHVRGNHDGYYGATFASDAPFSVDLPGVTLAVLDTVIPASASGQVSESQLEWLDELGAAAEHPVLVFGHHHVWDPGSSTRAST